MATLRTYLSLAEDVYPRESSGSLPAVNSSPSGAGSSFTAQKWEFSTWYGNGFQGGVFGSAAEWVVAFSGTQGGLTSAPVSQSTANARIGIHVIPNMAGAANKLVAWARSQAGNAPVTVIGHSLGGGLAQVVGHWSGCRFLSFNGPGMRAHLAVSAFNIFKPKQMKRTLASIGGDTAGFCYRIRSDFVGTFGSPAGTTRTYDTIDADTHSLYTLTRAIPSDQLNADPFV